jgi:hypothetical protein
MYGSVTDVDAVVLCVTFSYGSFMVFYFAAAVTFGLLMLYDLCMTACISY